MTPLSIDAERLLGRIQELGQVGRAGDGRLVRLAQCICDPGIALAVDGDAMGAVTDLPLFGLAGIIRREAGYSVGVGVGNEDPALQVERDMERSFHLAGAVD